jgi:hypothetical protein
VSIERFIECPCRHSIELHDANGCLGALREGKRCACALTRFAVLDRLFDVERDTIARAWRPSATEVSGGKR